MLLDSQTSVGRGGFLPESRQKKSWYFSRPLYGVPEMNFIIPLPWSVKEKVASTHHGQASLRRPTLTSLGWSQHEAPIWIWSWISNIAAALKTLPEMKWETSLLGRHGELTKKWTTLRSDKSNDSYSTSLLWFKLVNNVQVSMYVLIWATKNWLESLQFLSLMLDKKSIRDNIIELRLY